MALLSVIRRWHFRQQVPIHEIERRTGLSRNTIRKYLLSDGVEPRVKLPDRSSKLDPFAENLTGWLQQEAGKSRKQKRTTKQMRADLAVRGHDGSYGRVAAFVRWWKAGRETARPRKRGRPEGVATPACLPTAVTADFDASRGGNSKISSPSPPLACRASD